jgi:hypothetical protein
MLPVALALVVVILAVLALAASRPPRFRVERSLTIGAPSAVVVGLLDDLRRWPAWQQEGAADPTTKRDFAGAARGAGAVCDWDSEGRGSKGRMRIVEASPSLVRVDVDWKRPFVASNANLFRLEPRGDTATQLTWTLDGENIFVLKVMTLFFGAERLMGPHLERGLAALKRIAEEGAQVHESPKEN